MTVHAERAFHCEYCGIEYAKLDDALGCSCAANTAHNALNRALWTAINAAVRGGVPEKRIRSVLVSATYASAATWAYQLEKSKGGGLAPVL